ncbi:hypothetical protein SmJEL517_g06145 [Synchytrium microbalum]|uniref:Phosphatidylethanolamine-binding protein n=1 Tax=Synchytrium microbalum TaxID=1806994 RepID=A0A507BY38_9FUNG|nr:uncharacterized protein SmJEL517_g06145 [Synchytrium microbalum]TPX30255.1 hypothetical protein SmJEL517_g06145 [Synchytrium microbalum]
MSRRVLFLVLSNIRTTRGYSTASIPPSIPRSVFPVYDLACSLLAEKEKRVQHEIIALEEQASNAQDASIKSSLAKALHLKRVELGYMKHHQEQPIAEEQYDNPTYAYMRRQQFEKVDVPKLVKSASAYRLFEDVFPGEIVPEDSLEINFQNTDWRTCWGHGIPSNFALLSPEVVITPKSVDENALYTLMMVDIGKLPFITDRENLVTHSYHDWCHWLITNIPVSTDRVVIPGGSSPYLSPLAESAKTVASPSPKQYDPILTFQPKQPATEPSLPGDVIFPYVPIHPASSNPGREHRYVFVLLKQPNGERVNVDVEVSRRRAHDLRGRDWKKEHLYERMVEGEGEKKISVRERGCLGKTWEFITQHNLSLTGYGFLRSRWSTLTSQVYTRLGLHEPVFGRLPPQKDVSPLILDRIQTATSIASNITTNPGMLDMPTLKQLNMGLIQHVPFQRLATQNDETVKSLQVEYDAAVKKRAAKEGKTMVQAKAELDGWKSSRKLRRLSVIGAAGMVRVREGIQGANAEREKPRPRYQAV